MASRSSLPSNRRTAKARHGLGLEADKKKMEPPYGVIGAIKGLYRDNGKENGN